MARSGPLGREKAEARGRRAETIAGLWLGLKGYRILARRFRCEAGEVDLIAERGDTIAMVEVKSRSTHEAARLSLSPQGERRIGAAAVIWLARYRPRHTGSVRYDLVTVAGYRPRHWADAWRPYERLVNPDDLF
ncbi:YraN family protein [Parvularcula sp. LCG005]|uniref:YraN family protein n=1 Tax=Parvularcula sp. LCG005 TaxID=3078805 RepID=UPI002943980E|nr:YraN family protein [Parvularcula sp. LCG005]WOI53522.1 YraN family protein [Parvularcula sp. LCG005]